ncbi:MAG: Fpg/Nei family DNA glycosylase [Ancrocorticia sp.]|uniref:Fpg/Nei family DNA glycosylase n=1 Tax=Ancrocorticia sp. TaxID=2593684 RepID=UPI003F8F8052
MPEGDASHRLARAFDHLFVGQPLAVSSPQGRFSSSAELIDGATLTSTHAVGKHLFLGFDGAPTPRWIHVHLGLYGSWRFSGDSTFEGPASIGAPRRIMAPSTTSGDAQWQAPAPVGQVRLRLRGQHGVADLSGPNRCELLSDEERIYAEAKLGPDPLGQQAHSPTSEAEFITRVRGRRRAIGELVMDQSIVAGVGNIYRAEGLFIAGISPTRRGDRVSAARLAALWQHFCVLMERGLDCGRIETVSPQDAPVPPLPDDPEASRWYVYHRTGRPCLRCGTPISEKLMQSRRLFWCTGCQR